MNRIDSVRRQHGATFLGVLVIVGILGCAAYAAIRLIPVYKEYMDVAKALTQTAKDLGSTASPAEIRSSLQRRWDIEDIKSVQPKEIEINKVAGGTQLRAQYRAEVSFVGNVSLVVDFDKSVMIGGASIP